MTKEIDFIRLNTPEEFMKINSRAEAIMLFANDTPCFYNYDFSGLDLSDIGSEDLNEEDTYIIDCIEKKHDFVGMLTPMSLSRGYYFNCNFTNTNLSGLDFYKSDFINCNFTNAVIKKDSYFTYGIFKNCNFSGADLTGASLGIIHQYMTPKFITLQENCIYNENTIFRQPMIDHDDLHGYFYP